MKNFYNNNWDTLAVIDGFGILFRSFHATPNMITKETGVPIGAIFGSVRAIMQIINGLGLSNVAFVVALDSGGKTFRDEIDERYKSNRKEPSELLTPQFAIFDEALDAMNVTSIKVAGYEADDIIATICSLSCSVGKKIIIFSSDKDMLQIVSPSVVCRSPFDTKLMDEAYVLDKFGLQPIQLRDFFALTGDAVDNVPGVNGIGPKKATKILQKYQSIANLYKAIDENHPLGLDEKITETLKRGREKAFLSQQLVELCTIVPDVNIDKITIPNLTSQRFVSFLQKYEMKSVLSKITPDNSREKVLSSKQDSFLF